MATNDEARFVAIYEAHCANVWRYCRRRLGPDRADDAFNDVFVVVWRRIGEAPDVRTALPWLYRIAHLTLKNHWRRLHRRTQLEQKVAALPLDPGLPTAEVVAVRAEASRVVELLDRLRPEDAEILRLAVWEGLSSAELATVLGIRPDAAKQRLSRARRRLATLVDRDQLIAAAPAARKGGTDA